MRWRLHCRRRVRDAGNARSPPDLRDFTRASRPHSSAQDVRERIQEEFRKKNFLEAGGLGATPTLWVGVPFRTACWERLWPHRLSSAADKSWCAPARADVLGASRNDVQARRIRWDNERVVRRHNGGRLVGVREQGFSQRALADDADAHSPEAALVCTERKGRLRKPTSGAFLGSSTFPERISNGRAAEGGGRRPVEPLPRKRPRARRAQTLRTAMQFPSYPDQALLVAGASFRFSWEPTERVRTTRRS